MSPRKTFGRLIAGCAALCLAAMVSAAPPADYYDTITVQTGSALKEELRQIISGNRGYAIDVLSYNGARDALLASVDNVGGGQVRMIYTNDTRPTSDWNVTINREHTWPQSYGGGDFGALSDMHHLYLCDMGINSSRGNDIYGNVDTPIAVPNFTGQPGDQNYREAGTILWEVSTNHRGDIARAILYMDTRYTHLSLINRGDALGSNQMGYLDDLLEWHIQDPVDAFEQQRNDRVFAFQNNRNPYIDNPGWVALVYGGSSSAGPTYANITVSPFPADDTSPLTISVDATDPDGISTVVLSYRIGTSGGFTNVPMNFTAGDTYTAVNAIPQQSEGTVVQYYITGTDTLTNSSFAPISGSVNPFSLTILGDNPSLNLLATDPSSVVESDTVHVQVNATDDDGNSDTNLMLTAYWRVAGEAMWSTIAMSPLSGTTWQTDTPIPGQPGDTVVEYYVEAMDAGTGYAVLPPPPPMTPPPASPAVPASYYVEPPNPFTPITSAAQVVGKIVITEYATRMGASATTEFIELANISDEDFLLEGLMLSDNGVATPAGGESYLKFPPDSTFESGGIIVVFHRDSPDQMLVDSIPVISNRNGAPVQVLAKDPGITFNGDPVVVMVAGDGTEPQFNDSGDNVALVFINAADGDGSEEQYQLGDVIDGVGFGSIATANTNTGWGPSVMTTANVDLVTLSNNGGYRTSPVDTDTKFDWSPNAASPNEHTPGLLPPAFELADIDLIISGPAYTPGAPDMLDLSEGTSESFTIALASDPGGTVSLSVVRTGGSDRAEDFVVTAGATLVFNSGNFSTPQTVTVTKLADVNTVADFAYFRIGGDRITTVNFTALEVDNSPASTVDWMLIY